jgi:inorganic pyrophosphatase
MLNSTLFKRRIAQNVFHKAQTSWSNALRPCNNRFFSSTTSNPGNSGFATRIAGSTSSPNYRVYILPKVSTDSTKFSPWHSIPLLAAASSQSSSRLYNYINEIPLGTRPKYEIATKEANNPIKQDVKKGALRSFTYGDIPFNYGCLPQTWENNIQLDKLTQLKGDNDPLDVVEISPAKIEVGQVLAVKVLGVFALIDEGETDWKLLAIAANNPKFSKINSVEDIHRELGPSYLQGVLDWFRYYKTTDGKPENQFAFNGKLLDLTKSEEVIQHAHNDWKELCNNKIENPTGLWLGHVQ